jgi:hypothetical protein
MKRLLCQVFPGTMSLFITKNPARLFLTGFTPAPTRPFPFKTIHLLFSMQASRKNGLIVYKQNL